METGILEWLKILLPLLGALVVLLASIARIKAEVDQIKKAQERLHEDAVELLRKDVFIAEQATIKEHLRTIDGRLERLEKKIYNGSE